jgi:branched-chain amino acid transport system permease protein
MALSFERDSAARRVLVWVAVVAAALAYTQLVLEGTKGGGRGTPLAVMFDGLLLGLLTALTATGIVLIYRINRIINFAQTAIGAAGAIFVTNMVRYNPGFPFALTLLLGLLLSAATGAAVDLMFGRRFARSPRLVLTVVSIAAATAITTLAVSLVARLPLFPKLQLRGVDDLNALALQRRMPFPGFTFHVGSLGERFGFAHALGVEVSIVLLVALAIFLRYTRAGVAIRAVAENTERAALLGISVGALSTTVWTITGLLSGATATLGSLTGNAAGSLGLNFAVLLPPLAAAVLARMRSVPVAAVSAVLISLVTSATLFSVTNAQPVIDIGLFLVVAIGLLVQRRALFRAEQAVESSWDATTEPRPVPAELRSVPGLRVARYALVLVGLAAVGLFPFIAATRLINLFSVIALTTIATLSLVLLTGWAGQVSLAQFAFVGIGAMAAGFLSAKASVPFWFAVPLATVFTGVVAAIVGIPALRIRGLFLAITTFAFAVALGSLFASRRYTGGLLPRTLSRPTLFLFNFEDERSMYFLCVAALVLSILVVLNLRRSRFGRLLIAMRENEANLQSFGVSVIRTKLLAFAAAGGLAGFAGAIYAFQQRGVDGTAFGAQRSFALFVFAVLGGVSSVGGALLGAGFSNLTNYFFLNNLVLTIFAGTAPLILLYIQPAGLIGIVNSVRDAVLRIVAQRRQIVVPSLFADYDPDALARQLIPLSDASPTSGLGAVVSAERYTRESELYATGRRATSGNGDRESDEAVAIGAAAAGDLMPGSGA